MAASTSLASDDSDQTSDVTANFSLTAHLKLDYTDQSEATHTSRLLQGICAQDASDRAVVQQCTVFGSGMLANWTDVTEALPCLPNLKDIYWQSIVPMPLMNEFLQTDLPGCRLHLDMTPAFDRLARSHTRDKAYTSLVGSHSMASLKIHIEYGGDPEPDRLDVVHELLATCPNIRSLDLRFGHSGCLVSDRQPKAFNFEKSRFADTTLPPLQELTLRWYDFDGPRDGERRWMDRLFSPEALPWPFSKLTPEQVNHYLFPPLRFWLEDVKEWIYSDERPAWVARNYERWTGDKPSSPAPPTCPTDCCPSNETVNVDAWLERMSFANITTLDTDTLDITAASRLLPNLRSLTNLTIHSMDGCECEALFEYLNNPHKPLTALNLVHASLPNGTHLSLLRILESKHQTLSTLTLPSSPKPSPGDLATLAAGLPNLTSLTLRQPRALPLLGHHTPAIHFPSLEFLTIHVPTPGELYTTRNDTLFNATALKRQFLTLIDAPNRDDTAADTAYLPNLQSLELLIGPWGSRREDSMLGPPRQVIGRYLCTRAANTNADGDNAEDGAGNVKVECSGGLTQPSCYAPRRLLVEGPHGDEVLFGAFWDGDGDGDWDDDVDYDGDYRDGMADLKWDFGENLAPDDIEAFR